MALVGYEPAPNGGYLFHRDNGPSMMFAGPEAEAMRQHIDLTRPPDARTASVDPSSIMAGSGDPGLSPMGPLAPPVSVPDASGGMSLPSGGAMSAAPPAEPRPQALSQSLPPQAPRSPPKPTEPPPMKMGPAEPGTEPGGKEETRGAAAELAYALASQAPRGGGGKAAKMGLSERTVEGAASPEDQAANRELVQETRAAGEATLTRLASIEEQKKAYYEDAQANAADAALEAHARQLRAQDQAATVQAAWDKTHASLQREQDAVANQKVDPNRLFSGRAGTGAAIASTISVALGAFGASLTGGPNYALQIVNSAIQRDVDAQMDSLQRRGANADNAMSNFMRAHGLEPQEAKLAVTAYGQQYAAKLAETQATQIKSLESQQAAEQFAAEMRAKAAANLADLQSKVMAKATEKYKLQGGGGGPAAAKQQLENLKLAAEVDALETKTSGSKKSSPEGEVTPRLATSEAATTAAGPGLAHLKRLSDNASSIGQVLDYFGIGGKSALTSAAENQAYLDARAETGGNVPPEHRVEQIRKNLSSPVKATRDAQIEELYAAKAALHNSNVDVSKRTAKVGAIGGSEGPVDSSGAY